jgi:hypothetical protein
MVAGIILADTIGRVFYQKALNITGNDNGFVTMFQNLEPAIAALIAFCLSPWIEGLRFEGGWSFFAGLGLGLTAASLFIFSWSSLRQAKHEETDKQEEAAPAPLERSFAIRL